MKHFLFTICLVLLCTYIQAQERVDITTCAGTGTGIVCVAPSDSLYKLCVKVTPGPCADKNYTIDWGDGKVDKIVLNAALTLSHEYDLKDFVRNCSAGEFKVSIFVENQKCPNDNKGFRVTFNKNPQANPTVSRACEGSSIYISNQSCPTYPDIKFLWEFSDGQISNEVNPSISFNDPNQTYKVKLTATSLNCGTNSSEIDFKISKLPVPAIKTTGTSVINKDTVVCLSGGGIITLDGTVSIDATQYHWDISGGKYSYVDQTEYYKGVIKIKLEEIKEYTIRLTAYNNCGSKSIVKKIKVIDLPPLTLIPQPDACEEISYQISNPVAGATYTLNGKVIDPLQSQKLGFSTSPYIVSAKLSNACGTQTLSDTFSIGPPKIVKILTFPKDTTLCVSTTPIPLAANFPGGEWSTAGVETQNGQKVFTPSTPGDFTISYSNGVGKCYSKDEVQVKVDGIQATATDQSICAGTPFILLQATPAGGTWSTSSCLNCLKGDTLLTSTIASNQVQVTYTVTNANACKATAISTISFERPEANFTLPGGCVGDNFQPTNLSSGASSFSWSINGVIVSSEANPKLSLQPGLQKIRLIAGSGSCADTLQQEVIIKAPPTPIDYSLNTTLGCSPLNVVLTQTGSATMHTEYVWDFGNGTTYEGYQPPAQLFENLDKQNKTYQITATAKNECGSQTVQKQVVVRPRPIAEIGVDSTTLRCTPALLLFSNRSTSHDKEQSRWFFGDGTSRVTGNDTLHHLFSSRDSSRTFTVRLEIESICGKDSASVDIRVYPTSVQALYTLSKSEVCPGEEVRFTDATVPKPNRWLWKFGDGSVSTLANPTHTFTQPQKSYKVTLIAYTPCGYDSTQLTVNTTDAISGSFEEIPLACEGSSTQFVNKSDPQLGFVWDFGDGSPLDSSNYSPLHSYSQTGHFTVTLSAYRGTQSCKVVVKKTTLEIVPKVTADFDMNGDSLFCAPGPVNLVNQSQNADTFAWYFQDNLVSNAKNLSLPFDPGTYTVKLIASKGGVCKDSVERPGAVRVEHCQVDIPTAFTPNGDGFGDRYTFFGNGILKIEQLLIRNRWGEIVFEMNDVNPGSQQAHESWDGYFQGKPAPADMYVYEAVLQYLDKRKSKKLRGNIYLTR